MLNSKTLMTYLLTLFVGLMMTACPDDDCDGEEAGDEAAAGEEEAAGEDSCEEAGTEAGTDAGVAGTEAGTVAGTEAGTEVEVTAYNFVVVQDTSTEINDDGTPGADICEVDVICGDTPVASASVAIMSGSAACDGSNSDNCVCDGSNMDAPCSSGKDRGNGEWIFDGDDSCDGDNWASLGIDGYVSLEIADLANCASVAVTVTEKAGPQNESYIIALCDDAANLDYSEMMFGDSCAILGSAETGAGDGEAVPSETFSWEAPVVEEEEEEVEAGEEAGE